MLLFLAALAYSSRALTVLSTSTLSAIAALPASGMRKPSIFFSGHAQYLQSRARTQRRFAACPAVCICRLGPLPIHRLMPGWDTHCHDHHSLHVWPCPLPCSGGLALLVSLYSCAALPFRPVRKLHRPPKDLSLSLSRAGAPIAGISVHQRAPICLVGLGCPALQPAPLHLSLPPPD